jgi:hypothetical protein
MAASVITPDTWTDDTGTPAAPNGDGTTLNNNVLQNHIYARINEMFAGAGLYTTFTFGGLVATEGFGTNLFSSGGTGAQAVAVRNTTAGTTNYSTFLLGNDATASAGQLIATSSTFTAGSGVPQDGMMLQALRSGGLSIVASHASGAIRFYPGGTTERMQLYPSGGLSLGFLGGDPGVGSIGVSGTLLSTYLHFTEDIAPSPSVGAAILYQDSTNFRLHLSNNGGAFRPIVQGEGCGLYHSAVQSITGDGTYRALTFDSEDFDDNGLHSTGSNPTRVTIVQDGKYLVLGHSGDLPTNSDCRLAFRIDGSAVTGDIDQGDNQTRITTSGVYSLSAGQYVELVARHASVTGNWGSSTRALATQFMVTRVG